MKKKTILRLTLTLLFVSIPITTFNTQRARAESTVYVFPLVINEVTFKVVVESNSTVSSFLFSAPNKKISFNVTGPAATNGFCNVTIPKNLLGGDPWLVLFDEMVISFTQTENDTHTMLYFAYIHSTHTIEIIGTWVFSSDTTPPSIDTPSQEPEPNKVMSNQAVRISVNVTDTESGVKNVILSYTTTHVSWTNVTMAYNSTATLYEAMIPSFPDGTHVCYKIIAYDNAGNFAVNDNEEQYFCYQVSLPVGGISIPVNKLELLSPYIGLTILLAVAVITLSYVKKRKTKLYINS